jgi:hypothetical protein
MKSIRSLIVLLVIAALFISTGCLELVGQRITLRHDAAKDELHVMIHYDGIHDSGKDEYGKGSEQVAKAVSDGEFMLLDWPFHIKPRELAGNVGAGAPQPVVDFVALAGKSIEVKTIGYHRDPDGRIGGSQLVTIKGAKAFIKAANAAISAGLAAQTEAPPERFVRSWELVKAAAVKGEHQWLALEGNALKVSLPIHAREWAALKAHSLAEVAKEIFRIATSEEAEQKKEGANIQRIILALTSAPISYSDAGGMLTVRLGEVDSSSTVRLELDKTYKPNLEEAVAKSAPADLDAVMARLMSGEKPENAGLADEVMKWGPPEEKIRGLLRQVKANDPKAAAKAVNALETFAQQWNKSQGIPKAPVAVVDTEQLVEEWSKWYAAMLRFPLVE